MSRTLNPGIAAFRAFKIPAREIGELPIHTIAQDEVMVISKQNPMIVEAKLNMGAGVLAMREHEFMVAHLSPSGYAARVERPNISPSSPYAQFLIHAYESNLNAVSEHAINVYLDHMLDFIRKGSLFTYVVAPVFEHDFGILLGAKRAIEYLWVAGIKAKYVPFWNLEVTPTSSQPRVVNSAV